MAKIGISIKIDVSKIDKDRLFQGQKGIYLDLTTFIDTDNEGMYGDHGFISQSTTKEERQMNVQTPILGNCKVFYSDLQQQQEQQQGYQQQAPQAPQAPQQNYQAPQQHPQSPPQNQPMGAHQAAPQQSVPQGQFDDDIPFN